MKIEEKILQRFEMLEKETQEVPFYESMGVNYVKDEYWARWSTSTLNLIEIVFRKDSVPFQSLKNLCDNWIGYKSEFEKAKGIFQGAFRDYQAGFFTSLSSNISGELFGDFVKLAKRCLSEDCKDSAAVVASAALEDIFKRYAVLQGLDVKDKSMQEVVNALKSKGLIGGAQKSLVDSMPKIRDYAMHAKWDKIQSADVSAMIGFIERFLIDHF